MRDLKVFFCFFINRVNFEQVGLNFEEHRKLSHNIWKYVYFLAFMKSMNAKDCVKMIFINFRMEKELN